MLEGVLERLLLDRLGEYVDLPKDSIQIGVWSGEIILDNVALRPSCLTRLKLPVDVSLGRLRKMHIKVPWSSLSSSPVKITLEGLLILAKPAHGAEFDPEAAIRLMNDRKLQQLESAEQLRAQRHWEENNADEARQQQSFAQSFISKIIANIQVVLRDVHIRYEDDTTFADRCFAAGLLIQEFTALTTNANFEECFVSSVETAVNTYKRLTMRNAAMYWDSNAVLLKDHSEGAILSAMQESIDSMDKLYDVPNATSDQLQQQQQRLPHHTYVLCPVSAAMNLTMNSRYFEMNLPHYNFELQVRNFNVTLHHGQYDDIVHLIDNFTALAKRSEVEVRFAAIRQHHPIVDPCDGEGNAAAWWRYACKCIIHLNSTGKRRWFSPASVSLYCKQRREYVELYKRKRNVPWYPPLTDVELARLMELEQALEIDDILFFRSFAETDLAAEARKSKQMLDELRKANQSQRAGDWWSAVFGSSTTTTDEAVDPKLIRLTDEQRRELYQTIDFKEVTQEFTLRPNHVYSVFAVKVVDASINLIRDGQYLAQLVFEGDAKIELFQGTRLTLSVTSATLHDQCTDGSQWPNIVTFKGEGPFAHFVLETDPVDNDADMIVNLSVKPVELVYNQYWIQQIIRFFRPVHELSHLRGAALSWSEQRQSEMIVALTNHRVIDVNFSVQHPIMFIPLDVFNENCEQLLVADVQLFSLMSLRSLDQMADESLFGCPPEPRSSYDAFLLDVHGASLSLCSSSGSLQGVAPIRILQRTNCVLGLYTCIDHTSLTLPNLVLNGSITELHIRISYMEMATISNIISSHSQYPIFDDIVMDGANTVEPISVVVPLDDLTSRPDDHHVSSPTVLSREWFICAFEIGRLSVKFSDSKGPLIVIDICGFSIDSRYSLARLKVQMHLKDVTVQDCLQKGQFAQLVMSKSLDDDSVTDSELITMSYMTTSRSAPTYEGIDQLIVVEFNTLLINWNPDTILTLMNLFYGITAGPAQQSVELLSPSQSQTAPSLALSCTIIRAHMKRLTLSLNKELKDRQLALAHICDLSVSTSIKYDHVSVMGRLGTFTISKPSVLSPDRPPDLDDLFKTLVLRSTSTSDLFEFTFDTLGHEISPNQFGPKFTLKLNSIQFVHVHQLTMEMADYLFQGVLGSVLAQTVSTAGDVLLPDSTSAQTEPPSVSIEVSIDRPRVLLPVHPDSAEYIEADLGNISFVYHAGDNPRLWRGHVKCRQMKMVAHFAADLGLDCGVLDLDVDIQFPLPLQATSCIDVDVIGHDAQATLSHDIYILVLKVFYCNLMALPPDSVGAGFSTTPVTSTRQIQYTFDEPAASAPMKVTFQLNTVKLECIGPDTRHHASAANANFSDVCLASLSLTQFVLEYDFLLDQTSHLKLLIASFDVIDSRRKASHSAFQKMVCTSIGDQIGTIQKPGIEFVQDTITTTLTISHPTIFVLPHLTRDLIALFDTSDLSLTAAASGVSATVAAPVQTSCMNVSVSDARIVFIEHIHESNSRLIATRSSLNYTFETEVMPNTSIAFCTQKVLVSGLECIVSQGTTLYSADNDERLPLLFPTSLSISLKDEFDGNVLKSRELSVQLGPIMMALAYEDYQLSLNIYNAIWRAVTRVSTSSRCSIDSETSIGLLSLTATESELPTASSAPVNSCNTQIVAYSCTFQFDQVKFTGINDCLGRYMPLISLSMTPFKLLIHGSNLYVRLYTSSVITAQAFNPRITAWEPILESCAFEVNIEHLYEEAVASGHFRRVSQPTTRPVVTLVNIEIAGTPASSAASVDTVNINLSWSFLETMLGTMRFWSQTNAATASTYIGESAFSPYYIRNETGDQLIYWLDSDANIRDTVPNGHEAPVKARPYELVETTTMSRNMASISLNIQVHGPWLPVSGLKFDKVGVKRFLLAPTRAAPPSAGNMLLVVECRLLNGIKKLTLRSSLVIVNQLQAPIMLYADDGHGLSTDSDPQLRFGPVRPGQSLPIPLRLLHLDRIYIRPDTGPVRWSETPISVSGLASLRAGESQLVQCLTTDRTLSPNFYLYISGDFPNRQTPLRGGRIMLLNPVILRNLLSVPISFVIKFRDGAVNATGSLEPGRCFFVSEFEEARDPFILITPDGFKALPWIRMNPYYVVGDQPAYLSDSADRTQMDQIEDHLILSDPDGYPMRVRIETLTGQAALQRYSERARIVYTIGAQYFFADRTGLGLHFGWSSDDLPMHPIPAQVQHTSQPSPAIDHGGRLPSYGSLLSSHRISMFGLMPGRECSIGLKMAGAADWSPSFNISSASEDGAVSFIHRPSADTYPIYMEVGVQFDLSPGRFTGTKLVQFVPRYVLVNNTESDLFFIQPDLPESLVRLQPHTKSAFFFACSNSMRLVSVSLDGQTWSGAFHVHEVSQACVKVTTANVSNSTRSNTTAAVDALMVPAPVLLDLHVQSARSAIHSFFSVRMSLDPPYRIQNLSGTTIYFRQKLDSPFPSGPLLSLGPGQSTPFSWDCLAASRPLLLEFRSEIWHGAVSLDDLSFDQRVGVGAALRLRVLSRGPTKILVVQSSSSRARKVPAPALDMKQAVVDLELNVFLFRICVSLIDDRPSELMLLTLTGIQFLLSSSSNICQADLHVQSAQIDNMDWDVGRGALYKYPVVMLQSPQPATARRTSQQSGSGSTPQNTSHIFIRTCLLLNRPGIIFFKYFGVLIQETVVEIDEAFYGKVTRFLSIANQLTTWDTEPISTLSDSNDLAAIFRNQDEIDAVVALSDLQQKAGYLMFFETLELAPIHLVFSFAKQPSGADMNAVSRTINVTFKNVDSAPIRLEGKLMRNVFVTLDVLINTLASHYHTSVMSRLYTILGSVAVLGNPLGLLSNLGSGLSDFFNDPVDGLVEGNLQGFSQGLKRGSTSLLNQSMYGFGNSLAGISGNLGTGIAALGTNREYRERRAIARARESPDDVLEGLAYGTKNIASGFAEGIAGVVIDPLKGAANEGVAGFFKGVASGAVGLFAKPLTGVLDAVSSVSQGVKNTANLPNRKRAQVRLPRMLYGPDKTIREYNAKHAVVQQIIRTIEQGRYASIAYIDHITIGTRLYVFLHSCIIVVNIEGIPTLLEEMPWRNLRVDIDECTIWLKQYSRVHRLPTLQDRETAMNVFRVITQAQVQSMQDFQYL